MNRRLRRGSPRRRPLFPDLRGITAPRPDIWVQRDVVTTYSIVPAHHSHLSALPRIELAAARLLNGYAPESVLNETTDLAVFKDAAEHGRLWIALAGETPVGFAHVEMLAGDLPHLEELDVDPSHGRRGLGTALVEAACAWATASGYSMLTLTTFRAVPWNMPFYSRLGFSEIDPQLLRPELAAVVAREATRGLAPEARVVMGYRCGADRVGRRLH